jgi:hypothetical protein
LGVSYTQHNIAQVKAVTKVILAVPTFNVFQVEDRENKCIENEWTALIKHIRASLTVAANT